MLYELDAEVMKGKSIDSFERQKQFEEHCNQQPQSLKALLRFKHDFPKLWRTTGISSWTKFSKRSTYCSSSKMVLRGKVGLWRNSWWSQLGEFK